MSYMTFQETVTVADGTEFAIYLDEDGDVVEIELDQ